MSPPPALDRFLALLRTALADGTLVKLTLGKPRANAADATLKNVFARPVALKAGARFAFVFRHATRDLTKNFTADEAVAACAELLRASFLDAHLFTPLQQIQLEQSGDATKQDRLRQKTLASAPPVASEQHDQQKSRLIAPDAPWLRSLGITNDRHQPREGMAPKFRQIQKFAELLAGLITEAGFSDDQPLQVADMGSGKGYLTFATAALLGPRASVEGIEVRPDLVELCNRAAVEHGFGHLHFLAGEIPTPSAPIENQKSKIENSLDVLIALHACDTATDDALAHGIVAGARLLVVSPCCQKELRPQLTAPDFLTVALRHGIFQERQAEFVTDALRAALLEWAGFRTKVFEFVSTEHTAKNLMIAAVRAHAPGDPARAAAVKKLASTYGIRSQRLAQHLGFVFE